MKRVVLEEDGTHLTIRVERASGRRTIEHIPARFLDFEWFAERAIPVRRSANYRKRRNRIGHLWMASTRTSVQFESLLERSLLLDLDYHPTVARVWSQPFRLDGIDSRRGQRKVGVYPDLLVQYTDKSLEVIEAKTSRALDQPKIEMFDGDVHRHAEAVDRWQNMNANFAFEKSEYKKLGWKFSVRSELGEARRKNLDYISAYRNLGDTDPLIQQVLSISSDLGPVGVGELAATVPGGFVAAMPVVLHLAWHHRLEINLDEPLSATTSVRVPRTNRPALKVAA